MTDARAPRSRDDDLVELADRIMHVSRRLNARAQHDPGIVPLSPLESLVIRHIDRNPGITSSQIAADLGLRTSNASTVLRALVEKSLLQRSSRPDDRRAACFSLTDTALDSVARLRAHWSAALREALPASVDPRPALALLGQLEESL